MHFSTPPPAWSDDVDTLVRLVVEGTFLRIEPSGTHTSVTKIDQKNGERKLLPLLEIPFAEVKAQCLSVCKIAKIPLHMEGDILLIG